MKTFVLLYFIFFLQDFIYLVFGGFISYMVRDKYTIVLRKIFDALQEQTETLNDKYENVINAHLEATAECIPTKQRAKPKVSWETLVVRKKHADVKTASKCNRKSPTNTKALKLKKEKMN